MITKTKILIGILILIVIISVGLILYSRETCIDSNEQCKGKPDGTSCNTGVWCDSFGRVCGGRSCVGLGLGVCINNKCELSPYIEKQVAITTDKTEYEHGEITQITVKNNLDKPIWYIKEICPLSCCTLYKLENNEWKSLAVPFPCVQFTYPGGIIEPDKLNPGEKIQKQWDMTLGNKVVESGKYKFSFYYGLTKDDYTKETIYSDEFTIETEKIACSKLDDNQCRNQPSCILLGSSEKAFLETGGEVETFLFEECVDRVPEYANCKEVVKMTQMYGGSQFPKECRCCCGGGTIVRKEAVSGKIKFHCVLARFFSVPPARNASFGRKPPAGGLSLYNDLVYNKRNEREIN